MLLEICEKVSSTNLDAPFRPEIPKMTSVDERAIELMRKCWSEIPDQRPSITDVRRSLREFNKGKKFNMMDNMLNMMEKYANNLEEIVESRTQELSEEKKRSETLLYRMLPVSVAEKLKIGKMVEPESFDSVTIFFSDIVGFTQLSSESTPLQVVAFLNDLYTLFDDIIAKHQVYKVETIGDAYMLVSGLPERNGNMHVVFIAETAMDLLLAVSTIFKVRHRENYQLKLRIGIHTGPCVAGRQYPYYLIIYCLMSFYL